MKHAVHLTLAAAVAATGLMAGTAEAATTTVRSGSATGSAYSGAVNGTLDGNATVSSSLGGGTCSSSTLTGSVNSDGTALSISAATFGTSGACGSATITAASLPWSGGSIVYSPVSGGKDANVTIANFKVKAVVLGFTCYYGGTITAAGYNPNNANRPDTAVSQFEASLNAAGVSKASGSSFLCPGTATVTALYTITGSGGVSLWVTS